MFGRIRKIPKVNIMLNVGEYGGKIVIAFEDFTEAERHEM